jgi:uncharacterized membrane protein YbhN (UPF0104 family)
LKRLISISLRLLISGVLLALLFREHDLIADIVPRLRALLTNWPWMLAGISFAFLSLFLAALRWHIILRGQVPDLPFRVVLSTEIVSAFFNISSVGVVGGDTYKIMSLSRRLPGQTMPVSVSLVLDHLTGLISVAALFAICMLTRASHWNDHRLCHVCRRGACVPGDQLVFLQTQPAGLGTARVSPHHGQSQAGRPHRTSFANS